MFYLVETIQPLVLGDSLLGIAPDLYKQLKATEYLTVDPDKKAIFWGNHKTDLELVAPKDVLQLLDSLKYSRTNLDIDIITRLQDYMIDTKNSLLEAIDYFTSNLWEAYNYMDKTSTLHYVLDYHKDLVNIIHEARKNENSIIWDLAPSFDDIFCDGLDSASDYLFTTIIKDRLYQYENLIINS